MSQANQKESVNALNAINFKLGDISSALGVIADLCKFYGEYDNLDERSRLEEALHNIQSIAKRAQGEALSLTDAVDALFPENENSDVKHNNEQIMEATKRRISPEEMKNATLSEGTKNYLVAFRMLEDAGDVVTDEIATYWGEENVDAMSEGLLDKIEALREEILRVMMLQVRENLWSIGETAI